MRSLTAGARGARDDATAHGVLRAARGETTRTRPRRMRAARAATCIRHAARRPLRLPLRECISAPRSAHARRRRRAMVRVRQVAHSSPGIRMFSTPMDARSPTTASLVGDGTHVVTRARQCAPSRRGMRGSDGGDVARHAFARLHARRPRMLARLEPPSADHEGRDRHEAETHCRRRRLSESDHRDRSSTGARRRSRAVDAPPAGRDAACACRHRHAALHAAAGLSGLGAARATARTDRSNAGGTAHRPAAAE